MPILMGFGMWLQQKYMPKPAMKAKLDAARKQPRGRTASRKSGTSPEDQLRQQQIMAYLMAVLLPADVLQDALRPEPLLVRHHRLRHRRIAASSASRSTRRRHAASCEGPRPPGRKPGPGRPLLQAHRRRRPSSCSARPTRSPRRRTAARRPARGNPDGRRRLRPARSRRSTHPLPHGRGSGPRRRSRGPPTLCARPRRTLEGGSQRGQRRRPRGPSDHRQHHSRVPAGGRFSDGRDARMAGRLPAAAGARKQRRLLGHRSHRRHAELRPRHPLIRLLGRRHVWRRTSGGGHLRPAARSALLRDPAWRSVR